MTAVEKLRENLKTIPVGNIPRAYTEFLSDEAITQILQAVGESMDELLKQWKEEVIYDDWEEGERPDHFKEWVKLQLISVGEERRKDE